MKCGPAMSCSTSARCTFRRCSSIRKGWPACAPSCCATELGAVQPSRRLFISRGGHPARRLENEAELIAHARRHGYEVVEPQHLDLAGQARLFHGAASVVGVKGAALANLLFCPAGAACLVLSPGDFPDPFFWDLASHAGVTYAELFGRLTGRDRPQSHNGFTIDPVRFADMLPR